MADDPQRLASASSTPHLKEFITTFETLAHAHNKGGVFADFVEIAACTAHQVPYHAGLLPKDEAFDRVEHAYLAAIGHYDRADVDQMVGLYATAMLGVTESRSDFLGSAYMQLEISNKQSGQVFTPPEVSRLMANLTFTAMEQHIKEKGYVTVAEPAAGAGGMLIESANAIRRLGFNPQTTLYFQATDVDRTCFNMAYFQLSTLGLCGEVIHGDSLTLAEWERRPTPQMLIVNAGLPLRLEMDTPPPTPKAAAPEKESKPAASAAGPQIEMDFGPPAGVRAGPVPSVAEILADPKPYLPPEPANGHGPEPGHGPPRRR